MDYEELAIELFHAMIQLHQCNPHRKINESIRGEKFAMQYIVNQNKPVLPSELSREMQVSSARIAATLNSLEKKGWITRTIDPQDRRRVLISLTESGKERAKALDKEHMAVVVSMLQRIGEQDAQELVRIIRKMTEGHPSN